MLRYALNKIKKIIIYGYVPWINIYMDFNCQKKEYDNEYLIYMRVYVLKLIKIIEMEVRHVLKSYVTFR